MPEVLFALGSVAVSRSAHSWRFVYNFHIFLNSTND